MLFNIHSNLFMVFSCFTTNKKIWLFNFHTVKCQVIISLEVSQLIFAFTNVFKKNMTTFGDKILKISYVTKEETKRGGGAFYSNKNAESFETGSNGKEISREKLQKIQKYLHFRHRTIQPKIPGRKSNGAKISRKRFSKTLVYLRGVFLFFRNYVNSLFSFQRH